MTTSDNGLTFIAKWEGEVLHPYKDAAGVWTIGIGHAMRPGESYPDGITHEQAIEMLSHDVASAEAAIDSNVHVELTHNQYDACVSLAFNIGGYAFAHSSVCRCINDLDFDGARIAFALWDKRRDPATGQLVVDSGLLARRKAESELFATA